MLANNLYLTFHGIGDPIVPLAEGEGRYFVGKDVYRQVIAQLAVLERATGVKAHVTFDDGNLSDYETGFPALQEHGRKGSFFVLAGRIGRHGYLSAARIRELADAGMEIGSHGHDHVDWRRLDEAGRRREFSDARKRIEDVAGRAVTSAAVPFGRFDRFVLAHLKQEGFARVLTSSQGLAMSGSWFCPRTSLTQDFDPARDLAPLAGASARLKGVAYAALRKLRYRF
ncbi:polysaccharide deacetylase family protein [Stappia sp. F7233]|uniref:Chitooligosaccharide deacetylase n=1 Tax=Stappia albiluteola TaxID=2758565 RepID=A0A839A8N2_9HYPH|nr:polysaccharide deacetylase family protein [Stappia albiluteola]MBA5775930.1 polysaccharide deacetylase family protein [Stappia albiluteola]